MNTHVKAILALAIGLIAAPIAQAVPVNAQYVDDPLRCDFIPTQSLSHELGDMATFPANESFSMVLASTPHVTVCVGDDGIANDWSVLITNLSGIAWTDLFFVADQGSTVGNVDGWMTDVANAPTVQTESFRIDGTVTITGANDNLLSESGPVDEIFQPGETWTFNVSNFLDSTGNASPPTFWTPGQFAGSSVPGGPSNASILAIPIPEPTSLAVVLLTTVMIVRRRRRPFLNTNSTLSEVDS